ncbi:ATP-dependent RecD-like DNA helicase [Erysipelotrichaceae bacterium]|nr:ATP-dependent RecD-like DNA helicase [Erysipelotrichaceae bacterium]
MEHLEIEAEFLQQIFFSDDSNYYIIRAKVLQQVLNFEIGETITITGNFHELQLNHQYAFQGNISEHAKYGQQFQAISFYEIMPKQRDSVLQFLKNLKIPGIGQKTIEGLYEFLGEDMLEKIAHGGIAVFAGFTGTRWNREKATSLKLAIDEQSAMKKYFFELIQYGFPAHIVAQLHEHYGEDLPVIIQTNCYKLLEDFDGISIRTLDDIVKEHFPKQIEYRMKYAIVYYMKNIMYRSGNSVGTLDMLEQEIRKDRFSIFNEEALLEGVAALIVQKKIYQVENGLMLDYFYVCEQQIAMRLKMILAEDAQHKKYLHHIELYIKQCEERFGIAYDASQKEAINAAFSVAIFLLTGGPGTGKTTIIRTVLEIYMLLEKSGKVTEEQLEKKIMLLAPTGRAAQRMQDATLFPAKTIHSFLGWDKHKNSYRYNDNNPKSDVEFVILDEASMIDMWLMNALLKALPNLKHLIIVGDKNQLPSVSSGQVFSDLLSSPSIANIALNKIFRQKKNSTIIDVASTINRGEYSDVLFQQSSDYSFLEISPQQILIALEKICQNALKKGYDMNQIQILAPIYKGIVGIDAINQHLQQFFNPNTYEPDACYFQNDTVFFLPNDKIIQLKNMPDFDVYNGDIGRIDSIEKISEKQYEVVIDFGGNFVIYSNEEMKLIRHAYCISVHKSQGSEFPIVIMPMFFQYSIMLYRQLLYTGASRAKHSLVMIGQKQALIESIRNDRENMRLTHLKALFDDVGTNIEVKSIEEALKLGILGENTEGMTPFDFL